MSIDPFREVRDAVRPSAAAGHLTDMRATQIANRYRVDLEDVRRLYHAEHARLHPQTPPADLPDPSPDQPAPAAGDPKVEPTVEPSDPRLPWGIAPNPCGATARGGCEACICGLPAGHDGSHRCREPDHADPTQPCNTGWVSSPAPENARVVAVPAVEPLTGAEQAQASDAVLALSMLGDHPMPDKVRHLLDAAMDDVQALHNALRDHHRTADLVAEQAVLLARLAEISQALGEGDEPAATTAAADVAPAPVGGGRVNCHICGREYYANGLPRHMATHKKKAAAS